MPAEPMHEDHGHSHEHGDHGHSHEHGDHAHEHPPVMAKPHAAPESGMRSGSIGSKPEPSMATARHPSLTKKPEAAPKPDHTGSAAAHAPQEEIPAAVSQRMLDDQWSRQQQKVATQL